MPPWPGQALEKGPTRGQRTSAASRTSFPFGIVNPLVSRAELQAAGPNINHPESIVTSCVTFVRPCEKLPLEANFQMNKRPRKARRHSGKLENFPDRSDSRRLQFSRKLTVLYEDDAVVVLNKPAGLPAVPIKGSRTDSAWSLLSAQLERKRQHAFVVHRIDRFTSGILLFAKTQRDREALIQQFLSHTPVRDYLAVLRGHLKNKQGTLVHFLRREGMFQKLCSENNAGAARAELRYSVEGHLRGASLVRVALVTGLQNQIRVQFSAIGHPVIGDRKYHPAESSERLIARVALHAARLQFVHPRTGAPVSIDCEPPQDFQYLVQKLSRPHP
jgi:23S rRNA pseudouridine1911/1915/1917 synthase